MKIMEKNSRLIAVILVLVIGTSIFVSCVCTTWAWDQIESGGFLTILGIICLLPCMAIDVIIDFVAAFVVLFGGDVNLAAPEGVTPMTDYELSLLTEKTASLPEEDGTFLTALIFSIPETERASALEQLNSVPEQQFASKVKIMRAICELPQKDRIFLAETIRSMPKTEKDFLTETANSLTDEEIANLADELISIPTREITQSIKNLREIPLENWGYREFVKERFLTH